MPGCSPTRKLVHAIAHCSCLVAYCLSTNPQVIAKFWMDDGALGSYSGPEVAFEDPTLVSG
jgi:hypothetical protein